MDVDGYSKTFWIVVYGLGLLIALAWIIVPFAIIGTKPILRQLLDALREQNRQLRELEASLKSDDRRKDT